MMNKITSFPALGNIQSYTKFTFPATRTSPAILHYIPSYASGHVPLQRLSSSECLLLSKLNIHGKTDSNETWATPTASIRTKVSHKKLNPFLQKGDYLQAEDLCIWGYQQQFTKKKKKKKMVTPKPKSTENLQTKSIENMTVHQKLIFFPK